jgi:hypothetical protein
VSYRLLLASDGSNNCNAEARLVTPPLIRTVAVDGGGAAHPHELVVTFVVERPRHPGASPNRAEQRHTLTVEKADTRITPLHAHQLPAGAVRTAIINAETSVTVKITKLRLQDATEVWGISNHTGEGAEELRARLVATALDPKLLPHVGQERPVAWSAVDSLARDCGGAPHVARSELRRRAAAEGVANDTSFNDALWFWHEVGSLVHYRDVPALAETAFVDPKWILALVNGLVEQKHKKTFDGGPALSRLIKTGVLEHALVGPLWREGAHPVTPAVAPADECMLLELLTQSDLLMLEGPEPQTSFVPLMLPQTLVELPPAAQRLVAMKWPVVPAAGTVQAGGRFLLTGGMPPGLVERLLARCAALAGCRVAGEEPERREREGGGDREQRERCV